VNNLETNLSEHDNYQSCINVISNINAIDNNYILTNDNNLNDMNPDLSLNNLNSTCFDGNSLLIAHSTPARVFSDCSFVNKNTSSVMAHSLCVENESSTNDETTTITKY